MTLSDKLQAILKQKMKTTTMKKLINISLTLCIIVTACCTNPEDQSTKQANQSASKTSEVKIDLPKTFYKKMKGTISDNLSVTMELTKTDSTFTGSYYYNNVGLPLSLIGQISFSGEIELSEMNEKYVETGKFHGKFTSAELFEGTWTNPKTNKSLPFKLTESKDGIANISFENFHKENCAMKDKNKNKPANGINWIDTLCSHIDINLIKVSTTDHITSNLINKSIVNIICNSGEKKYSTINGYLNSILELGDEEYLSLDCNSSVVTNDNNILCLSIGESNYTGGAHPFSLVSYCNFDLLTGKEIKLEEILKVNYSDKLNHIGEKIFTDSYGKEGWDFEKGKFKLNKNFAITTGGLLFSFGQYEIGPYAAGAPEVFIPFKDIEGLIKVNGLLTRMRQK